MTTTLKKEKKITEKTVYMEATGTNRVTYRVTAAKRTFGDETRNVYGVEAEMKLGPVRICENIADFSMDVQQAVGFAELLLRNNIKPSLIYNAALCYLRKTI